MVQLAHVTLSRLNPHLKVDVHKVAVGDSNKPVYYSEDCPGCNGGISEVMTDTMVEGVRLLSL